MGSERTGTNVRIIRSIKGMYRTYFEENCEYKGKTR